MTDKREIGPNGGAADAGLKALVTIFRAVSGANAGDELRRNRPALPSRDPLGLYAEAIGIKEDKTVNFHSFRHGLSLPPYRGTIEATSFPGLDIAKER